MTVEPGCVSMVGYGVDNVNAASAIGGTIAGAASEQPDQRQPDRTTGHVARTTDAASRLLVDTVDRLDRAPTGSAGR